MDSARAFRKYLSARIRAERMELLPTTQRHPPLQRYNHSYSRLPAGGRLSESFHLNLNRFVGRKSSQKTLRKSDVLEPQPQPQTKSKKVKSKCRLKFKNPVLVVRSRPRLECSSSSEGASIKVRFSKSPLRPGNLREQPPLSCVTDHKQSCAIIESKSSPSPIIETKSSPCPILESKSSPSPIIEPKSSSVTKERHISFTEVEQPPCDTHITQQLTTLMQKLEDQLASEKKQKEELNAINSQLKQLTGTVTNLNDKCKQLETEKSKLKLEQPCLGNQGCEEKLCHKPSSICQFCAHQQLPVLSSMQNELFQLMGKRLFSDVALTILLRADNVYHVNVRDLDTGKVLGCLLVNETGIKQANSCGIFQEILTFCVIDVRSSMSTRDAIFGGINFEFVRDQRLHGGHSAQRKQLFKEMHCPINSLKADQAVARAPHRCSSFQHQRGKKSKSKLSISQALLQIGTIDKSLVLSDDEANYPVSGIEIVSMMESSPPCSEMDRYSS